MTCELGVARPYGNLVGVGASGFLAEPELREAPLRRLDDLSP